MQFYVIKQTVDEQESKWITEFLDEDDSKKGPAPQCPVCHRFIGSLQWLPPFRAELECWGSGYGDWVFGPGDNILVSKRFREMFHDEKLTGLTGFEPVEIIKVVKHRAKFRGEPPAYFRVSPVRSRAAVDAAVSELEERIPPEVCPECRLGGITKRTKRLVLEPNTWSGENVFIARGLTGDIFADSRFRDACLKHGMQNVILIPSEQFSFDLYPWESSRPNP